MTDVTCMWYLIHKKNRCSNPAVQYWAGKIGYVCLCEIHKEKHPETVSANWRCVTREEFIAFEVMRS